MKHGKRGLVLRNVNGHRVLPRGRYLDAISFHLLQLAQFQDRTTERSPELGRRFGAAVIYALSPAMALGRGGLPQRQLRTPLPSLLYGAHVAAHRHASIPNDGANQIN